MTAQINEALCKVLCHNLKLVIQSVRELGIEATFGADLAQQSTAPVVMVNYAVAANGPPDRPLHWL